MRLPTERTFVLSALAFTAAGLLCAAALARALTFDVSPPADAAADVDSPQQRTQTEADPPPTPRVPSEAALPLDALALAVDQDPFQPDRRRPEPYRLPGEEVELVEPTTRVAAPPPFQVIGTAVAGREGLAIVQVENGSPQIVAVGESVAGFRLLRVDPEAATVMGDGGMVRLAVEQASARQQGRGTGGRRGAQANTRSGLSDVMRELQQRLQERGLPQGLIEQMMQQQGRGRMNFDLDGRGNVTIRGTDRGDVMIFRADTAVARGRGRGGNE